MCKSQATHTSICGPYLYKYTPLKWWQKLWPLYTGVEFWDEYREKWCTSFMDVYELKELPTHEK